MAASDTDDANLHQGIADFDVPSMRAIELTELRLIAHTSGAPETHPVYELLLDSAIEDAAQNGIAGTQRLLTRGTGRRLSRTELERALKRTGDIGRMGEELLDGYFALELKAGRIQDYEWVAHENAISPFDFWLQPSGDERRKIEVKSTTSDFNQIMHISMNELFELRDSTEPYELYRIYSIDEHTAKMRTAKNAREFAQGIISTLEKLPEGVTADGISVKPDSIQFEPEITIELSEAADFGDG